MGTTKNLGGRPRKTLDWAYCEKLSNYGCTQQEIADFFGMHVETLDSICQREMGRRFTDYIREKRGAGKPRLRKLQWELAEQGSAAMAIWLGKHLLGQTDKTLDQEIMDVAKKVGLTREEVVSTLSRMADEKGKEKKKNFEEFCEVAGYPKPFPMQVQMMKFGVEEEEPRLLLGARGYGKTDYVVILGIAFDLYLHPLTSTNLILTKSRERNSAIIKEIQDACEKNGMKFSRANSSMLRVDGLLGKDNSVSAVTIKTISLRGRHPKRIILDDPVTEDDTSEATRAVVDKKWNEVNKLVSNILVIGQPAHRHDLYAKLRPLVKKLEVPHGTIPELDHDLEAQRKAGVSENSIKMSYHLEIPQEGSTPFDRVNYLDHFPKEGTAVAFIDPSHEGGDYTALTILKAHFEGLAVVGFTWKQAWNHCLDDMVKKLMEYNVAKLAFETNALGDQPIIMLRQLFRGGVVGRRTNSNKHSRIMAVGAYAHQLHLSRESDKEYLRQVVEYEYNSKNDDAPDSLASCCEWLNLIRGKR